MLSLSYLLFMRLRRPGNEVYTSGALIYVMYIYASLGKVTPVLECPDALSVPTDLTVDSRVCVCGVSVAHLRSN